MTIKSKPLMPSAKLPGYKKMLMGPFCCLCKMCAGCVFQVAFLTLLIIGGGSLLFFLGFRGPKGEIGPQGIQGPQGERGPRGYPGLRGEQGQRGETGLTGPAGPRGSTGPRGMQGLKGETGPRGPKGDRGAPGSSGSPFTFIKHGLTSEVQCPTSRYNVTFHRRSYEPGYSLFYREGKNSKVLMPGSMERCVGKRVYANMANTTFWLKSSSSESLHASIARCIECESSSKLETIHSTERDIIPECPAGYEALWTGYSFQGIAFPHPKPNVFQDLTSPGSCHEDWPYFVCGRDMAMTDCKIEGVMSGPNYQVLDGPYYCSVCIHVGNQQRPS